MDKPDKRIQLSGIVLNTLDDNRTTQEMSRLAYQSRTQFHRLFRALVEETPAALRRRLLLERAAFQLSQSDASITDIALNANYSSLEAFTRAFRKAFRTSPSLYRRMRVTYTHLPAPSNIHFHALGSIAKGGFEMDLFERFAGNDSWHTQKLLKYAATLPDEKLDQQLDAVVEILPWRESTQTLRQILENIVFTKEVWAAALVGRDLPTINGTPAPDRSPQRMLERLQKVDEDLHHVFQEVRQRGGWDDEFVDALCEPPENFTFGGVFAHIMTFNGHRRLMALDALRRLGVQTEGFGCPIEYERKID
jgi:AraC family transcriptional regulator